MTKVTSGIKVLIVEDHPIVREGVTAVLERERDIDVVGAARTIVVFTAYDADDDVFRAIRAGARGYLLKGSPAAEIAQAIRQVHGGESYLSPRIAAKLVKGVTHPAGRTGLLSARERGVLRLV